jgi:exonuclease SbcC
VSPDVASGGEKALLNLALRAGIYRTIAEAHTKTTTSTTLPPLILDEPTTYLDTHHVSQLKTFISQVTNWNMNQVIIVSHDETLVDSADTSYHVQKHTNSRSTVTKN